MPQKRRWPWIVGAIAAAIVLIGLGAVIATLAMQPSAPTESPAATGEPTPSETDTPTDPSTPSPSDAPPEGGGVDACLGGDGRDIDMLLAAREAAPNTVNGAISFGATYIRWGAQKPSVSQEDIAVAERFILLDNLREEAASMAEAPGDEFYASTVNGFYRVESMSDDHVNVSYLLRVVVDGAVDPDNVAFGTVTLEWASGGWTVTGEPDGASSDTMRDTGTAFSGGC